MAFIKLGAKWKRTKFLGEPFYDCYFRWQNFRSHAKEGPTNEMVFLLRFRHENGHFFFSCKIASEAVTTVSHQSGLQRKRHGNTPFLVWEIAARGSEATAAREPTFARTSVWRKCALYACMRKHA